MIKMILKGRSPTMRHVSRTHRVSLDWLFDRIKLDSKIQIKYIDTKNQLADILTKGNFTRDEWNHLLILLNIRHFSSSALPGPQFFPLPLSLSLFSCLLLLNLCFFLSRLLRSLLLSRLPRCPLFLSRLLRSALFLLRLLRSPLLFSRLLRSPLFFSRILRSPLLVLSRLLRFLLAFFFLL